MNKNLNSIGLDKKPSDTTIVVAMSGGVDSSTVAGIMKKEGYNVIGISGVILDILEEMKLFTSISPLLTGVLSDLISLLNPFSLS